MVQLVIPCLHTTGEVKDSTKRIDDYHPLTREEVIELLELAKNAHEQSAIPSQVQVRLNQAIKGYKCPRLIDGPVAEKCTKLDRLYMDNYELGADQKIVDQIMELLS